MHSSKIQIDWMELEEGKLGMCRCPGAQSPWGGKGYDLDRDLKNLSTLGVTDAIVLLPQDEITMFAPGLFFGYQRHQIDTVHFPVENMSVPQNHNSFSQLITVILEKVKSGRFPVIHCMAGRGRAGTVFACVLRAQGYTAEQAISATRTLRSGTIQTLSQEMFVQHFKVM